MNLFELFVKIGAKDEASGTISKITKGLGKGLATAAKIGTTAVAAAATGIAALTTAAVNNYAEYEQLVGGIETLYEDLSWDVGQNAAKAFQTAGLSANEYMSTAMSFAASLNQSLTEMDGNIARSADLTDQAILDMADNANKMGSDMATLQTAYAGFAKQNYTLLDNLKIGYGGTKEEMQRLIADAAKLSDTVDAQSMSFANIVEAIHVVQTEMGITGTTALEAGRTISGSVGAMKSAWTNLLTGLADGNADVGELVNNLVTTIVGDGTESNLGVFGNVMPAVKRALNGVSKLVENLFPKIIKEIPEIIDENLPVLAKAAVGVVESLVNGISQNQKKLTKTAVETVTFLANSILKLLPKIVQLGLDLIVSLADGISKNLPKLTPTVVNVVLQIVKMLTNPTTLTNLMDAALKIISELAEYLLRDDVLDSLIDSAVQIIISIGEFLTNNVDKLFSVATKIIVSLLNYLIDPENLGELLTAGVEIIAALADALLKSVEGLSSSVTDVIAWIVKEFTGIDLSEQGKEAMESFILAMFGVIKVKRPDMKSAVQSLLSNEDGSLVGGLSGAINGSHRSGLDYVPYDGYIAELHKGERVLTASEASSYGGTSIGTVNITVNGANYADEQSLASAIALEIQNMTDRRAAVYA